MLKGAFVGGLLHMQNGSISLTIGVLDCYTLGTRKKSFRKEIELYFTFLKTNEVVVWERVE